MSSLRGPFAVSAAGTLLIGVLASGASPARAAVADTRPPTAPTGLAASELSCASVTLTWSAATDDTGVAFYDLYHDGQAIGSTTAEVRTIKLGVVAGVRWGFYVNARDAAGNVSQASSTVWVTPPFCSQDTTAPSVPAGLIGSAIGTAVTLRWATDTDYSYTVTARDAQGNTSKPSEPARVRTEGSCAAVCGIAQVTTERDLPWGLLQLPDGTVLYGQRDLFTIQAMAPDGTNKHSIGKVPDAAAACGSARTANSMRPPATVRIPTRRRISPVSAGRCCG